MENFRIDFTLSDPFPDGKKLGECGEKNAVQLIITPPENLASREEIRLYVVAFSTEKGPVRYGPVKKSETVTVPVGNALTVGSALSVQLEGYDENGEFIIKSPVLSGIMISGSIADCNPDTPEEETVIPGHTHKNLAVLDNLSVRNGSLAFNGNTIPDNRNIKTAVLNLSENAFFICESYNTVIISENPLSDGTLPVPFDSEILSLEINFSHDGDDIWTDVRDLNTRTSYAPYIINMHKPFEVDYVDAPALVMLAFPFDFNDNYYRITNYDINRIRVKYIERNGADT